MGPRRHLNELYVAIHRVTAEHFLVIKPALLPRSECKHCGGRRGREAGWAGQEKEEVAAASGGAAGAALTGTLVDFPTDVAPSLGRYNKEVVFY